MDGHVENTPSSPARQDHALIAADTVPSPPSDVAQDASDQQGEEPIPIEEVETSAQSTEENMEDIAVEPLTTETDNDAGSPQTQHQEQASQEIPANNTEPQQGEMDDVPPAIPEKPPTTVSDSDNTLPPLPPSSIPNPILNGRHDSRPQSPTLSVASGTTSTAHRRSMTTSRGSNMSVSLISSALETIASSKEAKRSAPLREGIQKALELIQTNQAIDHAREILEPLRLACETQNEKLVIASLDCISKLVSYSFFAEENDDAPSNTFSPPPSPNPNRRSSIKSSQDSPPQPSLVDLVAHTIASCHNESTSDTVSVQIVKALLGLVLSQTTIVHHHSLLQSVRTVYNVYITSTSPQIQMLAQGSLTQIVDHVFNRCKLEGRNREHQLTPSHHSTESLPISPRRESGALPQIPMVGQHGEPTGSQSSVTTESVGSSTSLPRPEEDRESVLADGQSVHTNDDRSSTWTASSSTNPGLLAPRMTVHQLTLRDLFLKDAFLIFRALCKLSLKPIPPENEQDPKAHTYRSKVMSLQLILHVLNQHMALLVDPASIIYSSSTQDTVTFDKQISPHLLQSLTRNAPSPVPAVFELSVEIFWRALYSMRAQLKTEIGVLLHEIYIPILEMKTSTLRQKAVILGMLARLCQEPQALVEIYLNYDCDERAVDNIYERLMNIISKFGTTNVAPSASNKLPEPPSPGLSPGPRNQAHAANSLNGGVLAASGTLDTSTLGLSETQIKRQALECLVAVLRSLVAWGTPPVAKPTDFQTPSSARSQNGEESRRDTPSISERLTTGSSGDLRLSTPEPTDDPSRFESAKQRKTALLEGIKKFNFKPKRGIQFLIENGFIPDNNPKCIATFLHETDGLNKTMLGEYLGEGDEEHVAIMHAFVDMMDFKDTLFVDSLRHFLQAFRLPGEAQKIDRFLLKFAERYINGNAKTPFANADAAYVLGYSVIMLNTDAHNPQVKKRMTKTDFIKNNRGINDGSDLPEDLLSSIFDDIVSNEIVMNDEIEAKLLQGHAGIAGALASVGRDLQKEAYVLQTSGMSNKTETLLTMIRSQRKNSKQSDQFYSASQSIHIRPMFEVAWMPFLAGLSNPLQETDDLQVVELCLEGFRHAIRIVCTFDLDLQRNAFVTTLAKFTFLNNLGEMKIKNMEAIKALLDVAVHDGNNLKASWREVLKCVSQLEHMQLIGTGPDGVDAGGKGRSKRVPNEELASQSRSTHITVAADMVFSLSHYLSGTAIVDFVRALCDVSWEEIQSSGNSTHPRLFSLQKLVDISYYNMNRIRLEWSNLWEILGEHFNQVCTHPNAVVASFALDALRQLAVRFLEKEELPHFKFQKDFLKPFEYTMIHNRSTDIRDMVLQCLHQMIQAKVHNLRSGWRTMFGVFSAASKVMEGIDISRAPDALEIEGIVISAFDIVKNVNATHFPSIVKHGAFADLTVCITDFCKISKLQKISLSAIAMLRDVIPVMLKSPECGLSTENIAHDPDQPMDDGMIKYWYPVLFGFYDIIMNAHDLEVQKLALESLFSALKVYGTTFPAEFWDTVCQELLFPIFAILKNKHDLSRFHSQEDMSVWLQSTMFQALRALIELFTFHFSILERLLDGLLELLSVCICQENKAFSQIGTSCLQQLLETNVTRLSPERWEKVSATFVRLFRTTTPHQLFDENLRAESVLTSESNATLPNNDDGTTIVPAPLSPNHERLDHDQPMTAQVRQQIFGQIIVKCILQLLLIEMTSDLLKNEEFYSAIPPDQLLKIMGILDHSYQFARSFNDDKQLRTELWKVGFMRHLPNLLKQESTSAATLVNVLLRMYYDNRPDYRPYRHQVAERLLPLALGVLGDYNKLRPDTQAKNIYAWNPVVAEILDGFGRFDDNAFNTFLHAIYPLAVELLSRDIPPEIRQPLKVYFLRVGRAQGIIDVSS
ncbi:Sec7 domain-containing protein [Coprinopsis cinerea AmutBmut pab1-1]|nr:Sec7 domain-containing protein [Coprinopsis cinerea AmutBmut pab1-1]